MELPERFEDLPLAEQKRVRRAAAAMGGFAFRRCAGVLIAPPPGKALGAVNNGSAFILHIGAAYYLGTAWHVVAHWIRRTDDGEHVLFQVGGVNLAPRGRIVWASESDDVAFLRIENAEVNRIGIETFEPSLGWPPPAPRVGDTVLVAGFPGTQRNQPDVDAIDFGSFSGALKVTTVQDRHLMCQFERDYWIAPEGLELPPEGADLGGMSGGPALLVRDLVYPLIGVISQHNRMFEIMKITTLSHLPAEMGDAA